MSFREFLHDFWMCVIGAIPVMAYAFFFLWLDQVWL